MPQQAFFDHGSGAVRFWVEIDAHWVGASIGREILHYHYRPDAHREDPLETYQSYREAIDAAVRRRMARGAREPVIVRESDLENP